MLERPVAGEGTTTSEAHRVVYVDHDRIERALLRTVVDDDFRLVRATSGADAIARLYRDGADAVVVPAALRDADLDGFVARAREETDALRILVVGDVTAPPEDVTLLPEDVSDRELRRTLRSALADRRVDAALERHRRLESATLDVLGAATDADGPEAVRSALYDRLIDLEDYDVVAVGGLDGEEAVHLERPFRGVFTAEEVAAAFGADDTTVIRTAIDAAEPTVSATGPSASEHGTGPGGPPPRSYTEPSAVAVVPLVGHGRPRGVLILGTRHPGGFDGTDRSLLGRLGDLVGAAMAAADADEADRPSRRRRRFVRAVAHELRNPLQVASIALELGIEGDDAALEQVADALDRIERVVDSLVALDDPAAIDEVDGVDVQQLVVSAWEGIEPAGAELTIGDLPPIEADPDLLERMLSNLLRNCVDHGGPAVSVRVGGLEDREGFFVEDDGPGIPPADRDRVFEWGVAVGGGGSGVGLGLVDEICSVHGWEVEVTDGRDGGARFEVTTRAGECTSDARDAEGRMIFGSDR